ncbi:chemotaxis protein [Escherichia coli]|uniref:Chemotaxis protein n=1 Tax=Escherichia coli TaxID=562 RepID=A0A376P7D9_ECOLX|nr:chemotaxis protein [Escherichia coli]
MTGMTNVTKLASEPSGQEFLVFTLGDEEYGIDILKVQEIRGYDQVTRICEHASVYQRRHESARRYCADC